MADRSTAARPSPEAADVRVGSMRRFSSPSMTSGFPPEADTVTDGRHVSKVPTAEVDAFAFSTYVNRSQQSNR